MFFIREATKEDIANIAELERMCFPMPWSEESIAHDILENDIALVLVAESDDEFAGYADLWCVAGEGQLNNIAVMPEMRGMGIATALLSEMIERLRYDDFSEISLEVRPSNSAAIAVYSKLGFEEVGERADYYLDNGEEALIYKLILKDEYEEDEEDY